MAWDKAGEDHQGESVVRPDPDARGRKAVFYGSRYAESHR